MFWFSKGRIDLTLPKFSYLPGEAIPGSLVMQLKKPLQARGVIVGLYGEERRETYRNGRRTTKTHRIYEFKFPVDGEKEYAAGTPLSYTFQIVIPPDLLSQQQQPMEGALGMLAEAAKMLSRNVRQVRWYVRAHLDVPSGLDVSKEVQIQIA